MLKLTYNLSRNTPYDCIGGHVSGDHRTGANDGVVADSHSRVDDCTRSEPNIVPDGNGLAEFLPRASLARIDWMACC